MRRPGRARRVALLGVGVLLALTVLVATGLIVQAEWQTRTAVPGPVPQRFDIAPASPDLAAAPVLILLHGAGLNGHMWDAVRRHLDPRWRVIALDLPGHGARRTERYSVDAAVATVVAAARSVAPAPVLLVGDSLGGYTAMAAAPALPPAQLRGLVLAGCTADFGVTRLPGYLKDLVVVRVLAAVVDEAAFVGKALASLEVAEPDRRSIVAAGVSLGAVPAAVRGLLFVDYKARLARLEQPVLIANGTLDERSMGQEAGYLAAARRPSAHHFAHTPHGVSMRRSAEFATLVNGFAARAFAATQPPKP